MMSIVFIFHGELYAGEFQHLPVTKAKDVHFNIKIRPPWIRFNIIIIILIQECVHSPTKRITVHDKTIYYVFNAPTTTFQNKLNSFLFGMPENKRTVGRFWLWWEYNIKMYLLEAGFKCTKWINRFQTWLSHLESCGRFLAFGLLKT
jgi:hypothetical protein